MDYRLSDGYIDISVSGTEVQVDLFRVNSQLYELQSQHLERNVAYFDALVSLIESWGLPKVSHKVAVMIANDITQEAATQLGKINPAQQGSDSPD